MSIETLELEKDAFEKFFGTCRRIGGKFITATETGNGTSE